MELRAEARRDLGVAGACMLAALGREEHETENEHARAYVGAMLIAEGIDELRAIRKLLTPPKGS